MLYWMSTHSPSTLFSPTMADQGPRKGILRPGQTMEDFAGLSVINLSNKELDQDSIEVLSRGLTFCPTPGEPRMVDLVNGLDRMVRTMRYRAHFAKMEFDLKNPRSRSARPSTSAPNISVDTKKYPVSLRQYKTPLSENMEGLRNLNA